MKRALLFLVALAALALSGAACGYIHFGKLGGDW